eukprot:TRINITY_DN92692_c0_g1_i1.p1 TRINITY_DN92692_c0_g1~~TRINITY_DN92692_c0_g1_i1.p1  ORF type:complete len:274 (+),score=57.86 TRINITY_DN92692_c0_g1_i1:39-824(+)
MAPISSRVGFGHVICCIFLGLVLKRGFSPGEALALAALAGLAYKLLDHLTSFELQFQVVYVQGAGKDLESTPTTPVCGIVDGCIVKEMAALSGTLDKHLRERCLEKVHCPLFSKLGKKWVLYARTTPLAPLKLADDGDDSAAKPKKAKYNAFASQLAGCDVFGSAVVAPADRDWRPTVTGRFDMLTGNAAARSKAEGQVNCVSWAALVAAHSAAEAYARATPMPCELTASGEGDGAGAAAGEIAEPSSTDDGQHDGKEHRE